jgi:thymidylate synthase
MKKYIFLLKKVIKEGEIKSNRISIDRKVIPIFIFEYNMSESFPLLKTKKVSFRLVASELEFFIKELINKNWLLF